VIFGTTEFDTAFTIFAPALMMPLHSASRPTMKPFTSWKENQRDQILVAVHDEARGLFGRLGVDHAAELDALVAFVIDLLRVQFLIGDDADGEAADAPVATDQSLAILGLYSSKRLPSSTRARISFMS
jgi:hypothetical protein